MVNVSEGRDGAAIGALTAAAGNDLLDAHSDPHHHRTVLSLAGTDAARRVAREAVTRIDLRTHDGAHPRLGALDVVPFVDLAGSTPGEAIEARDQFARWAAQELDLPCFLYGHRGYEHGLERDLPEIRRHAFDPLAPDYGPDRPDPRTGATAVGARPPLVAYNLWLDGVDLAAARRVATGVRSDDVKALGLQVGDRVQLSMNLVAPHRVGPAEAWDAVAGHLAGMGDAAGGLVAGAELVGLLPEAVLGAVDRRRWEELDLEQDRTIEARLAARRAAGWG